MADFFQHLDQLCVVPLAGVGARVPVFEGLLCAGAEVIWQVEGQAAALQGGLLKLSDVRELVKQTCTEPLPVHDFADAVTAKFGNSYPGLLPDLLKKLEMQGWISLEDDRVRLTPD